MDSRLEEIAAGTYAFVQPHGSWCLNNAGLVVDRGGTALVDTAATEARARRLRELAEGIVALPPSTIINTHSHGDHTFGNFVFPEATVIAHEQTRTEAADAGLHLTTLWPAVAWGDLELVLPDLTYRERITLHLGDSTAELHHFGPAHTGADTAVWLPERRVLFAGDLIMNGVTPFVMMGSVSGLQTAIGKLREFAPEVIVPGHGPVGGPELLDRTERYLGWLTELARAGRAAGQTPLEAARAADLGEFSELLDSERLVPNLHRAYAELGGGVGGEDPMDIESHFRSMVEFHGGVPVCHA